MCNGSARITGTSSLNDSLQKDPKFNQLIFDLLVWFRTFKVAFIADLKKAFLQVSVSEGDQDYL